MSRGNQWESEPPAAAARGSGALPSLGRAGGLRSIFRSTAGISWQEDQQKQQTERGRTSTRDIWRDAPREGGLSPLHVPRMCRRPSKLWNMAYGASEFFRHFPGKWDPQGGKDKHDLPRKHDEWVGIFINIKVIHLVVFSKCFSLAPCHLQNYSEMMAREDRHLTQWARQSWKTRYLPAAH